MYRKGRIILIGNYPPDNQESMARFAHMLETGFKNSDIETITWRPVVLFGLLAKSTISGIGKWLGYIDKWLIFPLVLRWRLQKKYYKTKEYRFHICDHSNSPYLKSLPGNRTVITCHDVLAIRGALGFEDTFCTSSGMGKILQRWILRHLKSADKIACVSNLTLTQLKEFSSDSDDKEWVVIYNSFNAEFKSIERADAIKIIRKNGLKLGLNFLLHVGSSLPRKNRKILLDMAAILGEQYVGQICFAGEAIEEELMKHAEMLGLRDRVVSVVKPDHVTLNALYSSCDAFVFPSFSEGFGWPVIEAQACGTPVIASNIEPMPEISGGAAILVSPTKPGDFAAAFVSLKNSTLRSELIKAGFHNIIRFSSTAIIKDYLGLHGLLHG